MRTHQLAGSVVVLGAVLFTPAAAIASAPVTFTYQGRLTNASGTPITDSNVVIRVRILNSAGTCILYSEQQTVNTANTSGIVSLEVGSETSGGSSAKRVSGEDRGNAMTQVFQNSGTIPGKQLSSPSTDCSPDYSPSASDDRKLQVTIVSTSSLGTINLALSPLQRISSVPFATVAQSLGGYTADQFLRLNGAVVAPSANVTGGNVNTLFDLLFASSSANYNKLNEILTNYTTGSGFTFSSLNMSMGNNRITNLGAPTAGTDAVNRTYADANVGGKAVDTTSLAGLSGAAGNGSSLRWNQTSQRWEAYDPNTILRGLPLPAPSAPTTNGQSIRLNSSSTAWEYFDAGSGVGSVTSVAATAPLEVTGTATVTPTVQFTAGTAVNAGFVLQASNGAQPAFVNPANIYILKGGQAGATSLGTTDATALTFLTNNSTRMTVLSDGNVGIGTLTPGVRLDVNGGIRPGNQTAVATCNAAAEGTQRYNSSTKFMEFCDGTSWVGMPRLQSTAPPTTPPGSGYFVITKSTWNGAHGGREGANTRCLDDLTTNTTWMGYADAQARGLLVASKVRAFLCDTATCNNPMPMTTYFFANANDVSYGGASFTTDGSTSGPQDTAFWNAANRFGGTFEYWSGRAPSGCNGSNWSSSPGATCDVSTRLTCGNWTNSTNSQTAFVGSTSSNAAGRFNTGVGSTCDVARHLLCMVDP